MKLAAEPTRIATSRGQGRAKAVPSSTPTPKEENGHTLKSNGDAIHPPEGLQRSESKRRALIDSMSDLVFSLKKDGSILECHVPRDTTYTLCADGLVGKRVIELLPIQMAQQAMHYLEKAVRTGQRQTFTCPYLLGGQTREFEARITASGPGEAVAVVRDVTFHKATEKEILEISNREQVRIGQRVRFRVHPAEGDEDPYPVFTPAESA